MTAPPFPPAAPPAGWADLVFFRDTWPEIAARLNGRDWLPGPERVFAALATKFRQQMRAKLDIKLG